MKPNQPSAVVGYVPLNIYTYSCLVAQSCRLFATPWTVARQAPLSMGILQARILEWVAYPFSRGSFQPRNRIGVSESGRILYQLIYQGSP